MKYQLIQLLITSITLLVMSKATAQPVSTSQSFTLEQGLSCLDWAKKEQSFTNQLALGASDIKSSSAIKALQQQFQHQYRKQKPTVITDPDDENFCEDCPETAIYLLSNKSNPIQRIETLKYVSVAGANTSVYRNDEILQTKQKIEEGLKIKFSHYSGQQFKSFKQQWDKASLHDDQNRSKAQKIFQQYLH